MQIAVDFVVDHYGHSDLVLPKENFNLSQGPDRPMVIAPTPSPVQPVAVTPPASPSPERGEKQCRIREELALQERRQDFERYFTETCELNLFEELFCIRKRNDVLCIHKPAKKRVVRVHLKKIIHDHFDESILLENLKDEEFFLICMTRAQKRHLIHNSDILIYHKTESPHSKLVVFHLSVIHNKAILPVAICFFKSDSSSDSPDQYSSGLKAFFISIKLICDDIKCSLLISNDLYSGINEWKQVFESSNSQNSVATCRCFIYPSVIQEEIDKIMNAPYDGKYLDQIFYKHFNLIAASPNPKFFSPKVKVLIQLGKNNNSCIGGFLERYLLSSDILWANCQILNYTSEVRVATKFFTELNCKKLSRFCEYKIGICISYMMIDANVISQSNSKGAAINTDRRILPVILRASSGQQSESVKPVYCKEAEELSPEEMAICEEKERKILAMMPYGEEEPMNFMISRLLEFGDSLRIINVDDLRRTHQCVLTMKKLVAEQQRAKSNTVNVFSPRTPFQIDNILNPRKRNYKQTARKCRIIRNKDSSENHNDNGRALKRLSVGEFSFPRKKRKVDYDPSISSSDSFPVPVPPSISHHSPLLSASAQYEKNSGARCQARPITIARPPSVSSAAPHKSPEVLPDVSAVVPSKWKLKLNLDKK